MKIKISVLSVWWIKVEYLFCRQGKQLGRWEICLCTGLELKLVLNQLTESPLVNPDFLTTDMSVAEQVLWSSQGEYMVDNFFFLRLTLMFRFYLYFLGYLLLRWMWCLEPLCREKLFLFCFCSFPIQMTGFHVC